jgi:hypothetical protein
VIKFVSDLWHVSGFPLGTLVSSTKTECHVITEILLKEVLNNITLTPYKVFLSMYRYIYMVHCKFNNKKSHGENVLTINGCVYCTLDMEILVMVLFCPLNTKFQN